MQFKQLLDIQQARQLKELSRAPCTRMENGVELLDITLKAELAVDLEKRTIEAYASKFDVWDDWNDIMRSGAFARSIVERFVEQAISRIKVLHSHRWAEAVGLPIHMEEDSSGLLTVSQISQSDIGQRTLIRAAEGIIDGVSVGFRIVLANWLEWSSLEDLAAFADGLPPHDPYWLPPREIVDVDLFEYSFCPFPAVDDARIGITKSLERVLVAGGRHEQRADAAPEEMSDKAKLKAAEEAAAAEAAVKTMTLEQMASAIADLTARVDALTASQAPEEPAPSDAPYDPFTDQDLAQQLTALAAETRSMTHDHARR